jgi:hypothetical protein
LTEEDILNLRTTAIYWTPNKDRLKLVPLGQEPGGEYCMSSGAVYTAVRLMNEHDRVMWVHKQALQLIVNHGMDPVLVHATFCEIKEYRLGLAIDSKVPDHLREKFDREISEGG